MLVIGKLIAYAPDRVKINRVFRVRFKIFTEGQDKIINGTGGRIYVVVPHRFQYLLARYRIITALDKQLKKHGFLFGKRGDRAVGIYQFKGVEVNGFIADFITVKLFKVIAFKTALYQVIDP